MKPDHTANLRALLHLLTGKRRLPAVPKQAGDSPEAIHHRMVQAILSLPEVQAAFPETTSALAALSDAAQAAGNGATATQEHALPDLLPPALSTREASALLARAAETPRTLDLYEALTRHGLRRAPPGQSVE